MSDNKKALRQFNAYAILQEGGKFFPTAKRGSVELFDFVGDKDFDEWLSKQSEATVGALEQMPEGERALIKKSFIANRMVEVGDKVVKVLVTVEVV